MDVCSTCKYTCKGKYPCREVKPDERKPVTNGDCIRTMTDEGLAELLSVCETKAYKRCGYSFDEQNFFEQWLNWLKQEAEE